MSLSRTQADMSVLYVTADVRICADTMMPSSSSPA